MLDENLIATLEQSLRQTRNAQNRLVGKLRESESEVAQLRVEISALENSAVQTEKAIDSLLVTMRSGNYSSGLGRTFHIEEDDVQRGSYDNNSGQNYSDNNNNARGRSNQVTYLGSGRNIPSISNNLEAISNRFNDRTITQACTLLLRENGGPLHVNELYNLLVSGGMKFKGNNPTISIAVSLNRNRRFRKVDPGTFDLVIREAIQQAS
jgi:hypothetical protein